MHSLGASFPCFLDINECAMGIDSCDKTSSDCIDSDGTFWCRCKKSYYQGANNKLCVGKLLQMSICCMTQAMKLLLCSFRDRAKTIQRLLFFIVFHHK